MIYGAIKDYLNLKMSSKVECVIISMRVQVEPVICVMEKVAEAVQIQDYHRKWTTSAKIRVC